MLPILALSFVVLNAQASAHGHAQYSGPQVESFPTHHTLSIDFRNELMARRTLRDFADVSIVRSTSDLKAAVSSGSAHIEIQEHLDLRELQGDENGLLGWLPHSVKSIRVRSSIVDYTMHL